MDTQLAAESYDAERVEPTGGPDLQPPMGDEGQFRLDIENRCVWTAPGLGPARCISLTTGALRLLQRLLEGIDSEDAQVASPAASRAAPAPWGATAAPPARTRAVSWQVPVTCRSTAAHAAHSRGPAMHPARVPSEALSEPLSDREISILRYLPTNFSAVEIAGKIHVSVHTVKTHLRHIYAKLGVHRRTEAIRKAREFGLMADLAPALRQCECGRVM